ncbi:uncharacterized protein LOC142339379 isoform X1 [Convolutriloba macropyga]|uniref:uncharacterized protein LOC142339379 isoform X1 n=1 Tax=Convolutriloba macropyga TaxID=536237 RepID=UPI003F528C02
MESKMLLLFALWASVVLSASPKGWTQILTGVSKGKYGKVINQFITPDEVLAKEPTNCDPSVVQAVFMTDQASASLFDKSNEELSDKFQYMVETRCGAPNSNHSFFTFLGDQGLEKVKNTSQVIDDSWENEVTIDKPYSESTFKFYKDIEAVGEVQSSFYKFYQTWKLSSGFGLRASMSYVVSAVAAVMALLHFASH